jgi:hypothetical protein
MSGVNGNPGFKEGTSYNVRVLSCDDRESVAKGTAFLLFRFECIDGDMVGESCEYEMYATDGRKDAVTRELEVLGFNVNDPDASWGTLKEDVVGKECSLSFQSDTWNGRTKMKVRGIRAKSASGDVGGVLGKIASMFGGTVKVAPGAGGVDKDGVPF